MSRILTIRIDDALREVLQRRAREQGRTMSGLTREILTAALAELPLSERTRHLRGVLDAIDTTVDTSEHSWRNALRQHN